MSTSFKGRHAGFYDLFYLAKPYVAEAQFIHDKLSRHGVAPGSSRVLELACGTGKHALLLAEHGYTITATDSSAEMVTVAQGKAADTTLPVTFSVQDMRHLPKPSMPYDAVICLFDSIGYVQTDHALDEVFAGVTASLRPGGLFIVEFWHAPTMLGHFEPVRVRRINTPDGTVLRTSETTLERSASLARVDINVYDLRHDGTYDHLAETQVNRFFMVSEMEGFASRHGFRTLSTHAGFQDVEPVTDETWHVVLVLQKSPSEA
jgi:SAM-dependent methyltransferase